MGRYQEALRDLNKSLNIEHDDATTLKLRAETYLSMGQQCNLRGEACRKIGKYEDSLEDLNRSLELDPYDVNKSRDIDNCMKTFQLRVFAYEDTIEWIPFDRLSDVQEIGYIQQYDWKLL
ncbi:hypothetical protein C2G38_2199001 [Gigaspora rosea]|uniref:Uncharacterized protein n=1 Tax=Gigaspora rosea TaxID=44941 RepID=A0A397US66_9GLOM|nr:hypothetical protein C2G38_2199001 [Gigaspora rosea]